MSRLDNGADYNIFDHTTEAKQERTLFNMSYLHTYNATFGELIPFYLQETVPNDTFTISNDILCRVQPMEVPLMSRIRIYTHYYYMRNNQAWSKWNYFITRGRSGNYETPFPNYNMNTQPNSKFLDEDDNKWYGQFTEDSLANALGLPIMQYYKSGTSYIEKPKPGEAGANQIVNEGNKVTKFNIIPFFMYQRIYRDYYMNKNLNQNDKIWFPDDDTEFMLGHGEQRTDATADENMYKYLPTAKASEQAIDGPNGKFKRKYSLFTKRYRNWQDDYFTTAMPWPQRGTAPELELAETPELTIPKQYIYANGVVSGGNQSLIRESPVFATPHFHNGNGNTDFWAGELYARGPQTGNEPIFSGSTPPYGLRHLASSWYQGDKAGFTTDASSGLIPEWTNRINGNGEWSAEALHTQPYTTEIPISLTLTMEKLRQLSIMQLWQERNGRTDGDYNSMIKQHFAYDPKQPDNTPIYIGGTVQDIVITEILQQSATDETAGNALGDGAGHGISAASGYVGKFHCPDYGWIMGIMSIVPDVTYTEGIDREWTRETFAEYYYPEFNGLGPQGILNKELQVGGSDSADATGNNGLWAYQERFSEMKHRRNRVSGAMANVHDEYFKQWTMARFFGSSRVNFNEKFVSTKNTVRTDMFTLYEETPFTIQVANKIRAVRPIPYKSIPKGII